MNDSLFVAPNATLVGDVRLKKDSSVWYGAVLRGDENYIEIGERSNIQDNCTLHVTKERPCVIGNGVSIGHNCVVHGALVGDDCIIGMGSVILTGAVIGRGSIVAAGSVVKEGEFVQPGSLVAGVPAVVKKQIDSLDDIKKNAEEYVKLAQSK